MKEPAHGFPREIEINRKIERAPEEGSALVNGSSTLRVRLRGCFITSCELESQQLGRNIEVLYSDPRLSVPKLTASHVMTPVGPSEGIGGQHGFPRWADYHEFSRTDGPNREKRVAFQAKRSDDGLALSKGFELTPSSLLSHTTIQNSNSDPEYTSIGEHFYFSLAGEQSEGLKVDGKTLDELLGDGAEQNIMAGEPLFWQSFDGTTVIDFPAGYSIKLAAEVSAETNVELGMLVWHRPGSQSIYFEPTAGFGTEGRNRGIALGPYGSATLSTSIELL